MWLPLATVVTLDLKPGDPFSLPSAPQICRGGTQVAPAAGQYPDSLYFSHSLVQCGLGGPLPSFHETDMMWPTEDSRGFQNESVDRLGLHRADK
jgi:hypothetical protein